jgi:hypothetical protein
MIEYARTGQGEFVAVGPVSELPPLVPGANPEITVHTRGGKEKTEQVRDYGRPFDRAGTSCRYAYLVGHEPGEADRRQGRQYGRGRGRGKPCITDGNCSSFGTGQSCGGYDCDGY